ncbi:MAG: carbamoyltransferase C-terminal domain-containing protein [Acidobacteriota bacterium]
MNVLGVSSHYHESACCLLQGGRLTAAVQEERLSRVKHDPRLPTSAMRACLARAADADGAPFDLLDVDLIAYYERPTATLARQLAAGVPREAQQDRPWLDPHRVAREIRTLWGWDGPIYFADHHRAHAVSAYAFSGMDAAAIFTVDGVGEGTTTTYGRAAGRRVEVLDAVPFPHSLGLLYATLTSYLGFRVNSGEYKVMGLAPYGRPRHVDAICQLIAMGPDGQFLLQRRYVDFVRGARMYSDALCDLFGGPPRASGAPIEPRHRDIARSLQLVLEEILLEKLAWLRARVDLPDLCMAGGVALNAVANGRILREGPFARVFVPPAPGDAGACLGAAVLGWWAADGVGGDGVGGDGVGGDRVGDEAARDADDAERDGDDASARASCRPAGVTPSPMVDARLGPRYDTATCVAVLDALGLPWTDHRGDEDALLERTVDHLVAGGVVGWFHGAMEFGPRALGARSLLADPRDPAMRARLNERVKRREMFRPFAPSVHLAHAREHFDLDRPAPFMLSTCAVTSTLELPAITHVDGSARPQTVDPAVQPRYARLIERFHARTGCPIVLNTSFNVADEPIVCSPVDALLCFLRAGLDALVLEDALVERRDVPAALPALVEAWMQRDADAASASGIIGHLYTFV